ncbi:MAG: sterol desaturase family protein [Hyphomicrobiales bacterium]
MDTIEMRFAEFSGWFDWLAVIGLGFFVLTVVEVAWDMVTRQRDGIRETAANFVIAVGNQLLELSIYGLVFIIGLFAAELVTPLDLPVNVWTWVLALIAADFTYYWMHRIEHRVRVLWAYHSVHHSSPEFNLTTALRLAWTEGLIEWVFFVPMVLLGFDAVQTVIAILVVITYQTWIHTQKIGRLGWLDGIFNTPSVHRVHHGANGSYLDKNYGGILIVWDRMFGTYQPEREPVVFGITEPIGSANPIVINFYEFYAILRDCIAARRLSDIWGYLFKPPGWRPETPEREQR